MESHGLFPTSPVKRKALNRDSRHSRTTSGSSFQDDAFPLVLVDNSLPWSSPPNFYDTDTSYEAGRHSNALDAPQVEANTRNNVFGKGRRYSTLPRDVNQQEDLGSSQKSPIVFQNEILPGIEHQRPLRMWNSIWLHPVVVSAFGLLFLALLAGLMILWHFAKYENGLSTSITNNHYAWTYGPTALLVITGVVWRQVDFYCRTLAPWSHLRNGPARAQETILLDYVFPILPNILGAAAANREWAVVASSLGILLLRVVIVFSTGLLVLTPTAVSRLNGDAIVNSKFVGTDNSVGPAVVDSELMKYYGVQEKGLNYQYGTTGTVAYDTLELKTLVPNSTVTATVNGVFPFFNCQTVVPQIIGDNFTWSANGDGEGDELQLELTLEPANCPPLRSAPKLCTVPNCPQGKSIISQEGWQWPDSYDPFKPLDDLDPCANMYVLSVSEFLFEKVAGHPANTSAAWNVTMPKTVGLVCSLGYTIDTVNITINTAHPTINGGVNTTGPLHRVADVLPGFSYYNLTQNFQNEIYVNSLPTQENAPTIYDFARMFVILNGGSADALLNETILKSTAEKAFKGVAVQIADTYLRKAGSTTVKVDAFFQEQRLQIRMVSVWAMGAGFVLLALSALAVFIWRPYDTVSRNPNSIASQATILASSPALQRLLEATGGCSISQLRARLQRSMIHSQSTNMKGIPELSIEIASSENSQKGQPDSSRNTAWKPISTTSWFMSVAVVLPLIIIVILEILQRKSDADDGLVNVSSTSIVDHSLPSIFASAVMISVAMMYESISFAAATLAPYQSLARGAASAKQTMLSSLWGDLPLWSTIKAIRDRHGSAAVALAAAIIGSVLTIVSSGLYTIDKVSFASPVNIVTSDKFVPSFGISTDGSAGAIFELIEQNNASYPALTYDELAFPSIDLSSLGSDAVEQLNEPGQQVTLRASVPAMRASLNCTIIPRDNMVITLTLPSVARPNTECPQTTIDFNATLPESCPHFLNADNTTAKEIQFSYTVQYETCSKGYGIHEQVVLNNEAAAVNGDGNGPEGATLGAASNPPGCPSLAFLSGYFVINSTSTENVTAVTCIQGLEHVQTETTFLVSKDSTQVQSNPAVNGDSVRWLESFNSTYWFTYQSTFAPFNRPVPTLLTDYFYSQVNNGPDGIPAQELTGPSNTQRFIDATEHIYRRYMAQLISATMRQSLNSTDATSAINYPATVSNINFLRLRQNKTSKIVLQVSLAVMTVCGIFVYGRRNMRHVLPHSPWSIAGLMGLLAGSEIVERKMIPHGAEFMSDKDLEKLFEGYLFSLGWWDTGANTSDPNKQRRFGIDIGKADTCARTGVVRQRV